MLKLLTGRCLALTNRHVQLVRGKPLALDRGRAKTRREGQVETTLQRLGGLDGLVGFPLAVPERRIEVDPARQDMDVVILRVTVAHHDPGMPVVETHL